MRSEPESSRFTDPTGREIVRLTNSDSHDLHTYYDVSPWNHDARYIAFSSAAPRTLSIDHRDTKASRSGEIYVLDTNTHALKRLATDTFWQTHTGSFSTWHPTENRVYFYRGPDRVAAVNADTGETVSEFDGGLRQLSPDGEVFAYTTIDSDGDGATDGVYTVREDGTDPRRLCSTREIYDLTPNKDRFDIDAMSLGNTKWSPDGRHLLVAMFVWSANTVQDGDVQRSLYIVSRDGSEKRWLSYFGHHHSWSPDGSSILYSGYVDFDHGIRETPRLFLVDFDGSNNRVIIDEPLGGHPILDLTGRYITTWDREHVILVDLERQSVENVATLSPSFDMSHRGTHPHSLFSPDGKSILYNSAQTGTSQLYLIPDVVP